MAYVVSISEYRHEVREKVAKAERGAQGKKLYATKMVKSFHTREEADLFVAGARVRETVGERVKLSQGRVQLRAVVQTYIDEDLLLRPKYDKSHPSVIRCNAWLKKDEYKWLLDKQLGDVTYEDMDEYVEQRDDEVEASTINRELNLWSPLFEFATKRYKIKHFENPVLKCDRPEVNDARNRTLDAAERAEIEEACAASGAEMLHAAFVLAMETGIRRGELVQIKWSDVQMAGDHSYIALRKETTKTKKARVVPLTRRAQQVVEFLKAWRAERMKREDGLKKRREIDEVYNFDYLLAGVSPRSIGQAFKRAMKKTKVADFRFHDCRHCATTMLAETFKNVVELGQITGHADVKMLARYYNPQGASLAARLNAVSAV